MVNVPRKCEYCDASWLECGIPNPDSKCKRLREGVWECYNCHRVVDTTTSDTAAPV
ncbi:hypothetical protein VB773_11745 [Haloarculaceae archaeon H-GB2-1]|nr:hypothetical protein [Haloarculaceae archaeon H-GB1-1]MEA5386639.1 hypothetical protein [Haloarculaceae archaeon H-GB11]MEA5408164.1 hypothetical protein [Haloarculaceae archaeon H-GB2-1]